MCPFVCFNSKGELNSLLYKIVGNVLERNSLHSLPVLYYSLFFILYSLFFRVIRDLPIIFDPRCEL